MKQPKLISANHQPTEVGSLQAQQPEFTEINSSHESLVSTSSKPDSSIIIKDDSPDKTQHIKLGIIACSVFGLAQGIVYLLQKLASEKYDLQFYQLLMPQSLLLMLGAFIFGSLNGVAFQDTDDKRKIYSFYSYSWPGNPYIHQMIIHRSMMAIFSYLLALYCISVLPSNVSIPLLMLLPFFIMLVAIITDHGEEQVGNLQFLLVTLCYTGVLLITNPQLFQKDGIITLFEIWQIVRQNKIAVLSGVAASIFGALNFLATRKIAKNVHPSVKTMYLGLMSLAIGFFALILIKPDYFIFWRQQYTLAQAILTLCIGAIFWMTQSSLSISLENVQAVTASSFLFLAVMVSTVSYKTYQLAATSSISLAQITSSSKIAHPIVIGSSLIVAGLLGIANLNMEHNCTSGSCNGYQHKQGLCCNCKYSSDKMPLLQKEA